HHGILGGEDWKSRIRSLIREADTIVFVLTPSSVVSGICAWELEQATQLGKRIVPVSCRPIEGEDPYACLKGLHYISFYSSPKSPGSGFGSGLQSLGTALRTDLEWVRAHTRYLERATEWEAGGRAANRLLSGSDVAEAQTWRSRRPQHAPEVTTLHLDYIR